MRAESARGTAVRARRSPRVSSWRLVLPLVVTQTLLSLVLVRRQPRPQQASRLSPGRVFRASSLSRPCSCELWGAGQRSACSMLWLGVGGFDRGASRLLKLPGNGAQQPRRSGCSNNSVAACCAALVLAVVARSSTCKCVPACMAIEECSVCRSGGVGVGRGKPGFHLTSVSQCVQPDVGHVVLGSCMNSCSLGEK